MNIVFFAECNMTNANEEVTRSREEEAATAMISMKMMQTGSSSCEEAPAMLCHQEYSTEWVVAAGNAAKVARRVGSRLRTSSSSVLQELGADTSSNAVHEKDDDGYGEKQNETTTSTGVQRRSVDDDDDGEDYGHRQEKAEYKKSSSATLSQSVHIIQQEYEQLKALIAAFRPFLVKTWNWLHYFFVTIIFLNLVDAVRGDSSQNQALIDDNTIAGSESKSGESGSENNAESEDNIGLGKSCSKAENMSPNTCSIQNQEVEKAREAMMAGEKADSVECDAAQSAEETKPQIQFPEITITLSEPEDGLQIDNEDTVDDAVLERRGSMDSVASSEGSGNLGDTEDVSDKSEQNMTPNTEEADKLFLKKIVSQVEAMFSDEHLTKDGFLLKHVRRRSDGFVSLKLVAGLRKVKQISRDFPLILSALRNSTNLEINADGTKVRRLQPLTPALKSLPIKTKEKENDGSSNDENQQPIAINNQTKNSQRTSEKNDKGNRRNSAQYPNNGSQSRRNSNSNAYQNNQQQNHRKGSNASSASSNNNSRHNSFSKAAQPHPADLFRNVYTAAGMYSSSGDESQSPQVGRRRGGSLPMTALQRSSGAYLSPNSSPPNGNGGFLGPSGARPKSNSYCEGASPTTMSPWLQKRKADAISRLSSGDLVFAGVIRQPRGPDGTKGFATGYRAMILQERLQQQNSAVSA